MKKTLYILILLFAVLMMASCKKEDDSFPMDCEYYVSNYTIIDENVSSASQVRDEILPNREYLKISSVAEKDSFLASLSARSESLEGNDYSFANVDFEINDVIVLCGTHELSSYELCIYSIEYKNSELSVYGYADIGHPTGEKSISFVFIIIPDKKVNGVTSQFINSYAIGPGNRVYKPVIYLYSEEEINLTIKFKDESRLKTTYPKYNDGWNVSVSGDKINDGNNDYYGLFYDEIRTYEVDFSEGFYVEAANAISFLEEKLDYLGFNYKERNEFIMYWLPILEDNGASLVYFEQTEERNNECPLEMSINPESMLRIIVHIKKTEYNTKISEEKLNKFDRNGFTLVEWGGTIY